MKQKSSNNHFTPDKWDDDVPQRGYEFKVEVLNKHKLVTNTKPSSKKTTDHKTVSAKVLNGVCNIKKNKFIKATNIKAEKSKSKIQEKDIDSNETLDIGREFEKEQVQRKSILNISQQSSTINSNLKISKRKRRQINKLKKLNEGKTGSNESQISNKLNKLKCLLQKPDDLKNQEQNNGKLLRNKLLDKLKGSRFRYLNEQMYTTRGSEALKMFQADPDSFIAYHEGYRHQVKKWPLNPLDTIIREIKKMPSTYEIADFGCGDARLSKSIPHTVHSFDLVSLSEEVIACDMANVPLKSSSIDVAVYCLSLMGVNIKDYLLEANRVLKMGGTLKIAEVSSRFTDAFGFVKDVAKYGFKVINKNFSNDMFYFMNFKKIGSANKSNLPKLELKSCLYKKR